MKTQIIALAAHDDLVSVRDRMSWAKAPRILLIWPAFEQVALGPLDLRILQEHARRLGARLGLVTGRSSVRRDAESFGIPVFRTTAEAQRAPWIHGPGGRDLRQRRRRRSPAELRKLQSAARLANAARTWKLPARIAVFSLGVLAVLTIALLFAPRAIVELRPIRQQQQAEIVLPIDAAGRTQILTGAAALNQVDVTVTGSRSSPVAEVAAVPKTKAAGVVVFRNLTAQPLVIPAGTIVYSLAPRSARFATLEDAQLEGSTRASVEVPIEALEAGKEGNLPAESIQGIEGHLSASASATNESATAGGVNETTNMPTESDRAALRDLLLTQLRTDAQETATRQLAPDDIIVPPSVRLTSVEDEVFEPPAGQAGSMLSLSMTATYAVMFVRGADLQQLAGLALDASIPEGFVASGDSPELQVEFADAADGSGATQLEIHGLRIIRRAIDDQMVNLVVRGKTRAYAVRELQALLPLEAPPSIKLAPAWWPWMPIIPFRIQVVET